MVKTHKELWEGIEKKLIFTTYMKLPDTIYFIGKKTNIPSLNYLNNSSWKVFDKSQMEKLLPFYSFPLIHLQPHGNTSSFPSHIIIINSISFFQLENLIFILIEVNSFVIEQMQGVVPMNGDTTFLCTKMNLPFLCLV